LHGAENAALEEVLNRISERDRYIFFSRALHGRSFHELALADDTSKISLPSPVGHRLLHGAIDP